MDADKLRVSREKLTRVFRYLEALNQHRNPAKRQLREQLWSLRLCDLPEHSSIQRGEVKAASAKAKKANDEATSNGASYVLKVQRPRLTRPPEPPEEIAAWLASGWDDPSSELAIEELRREPEEAAGGVVARFEDEQGRVASFERWKAQRGEWAQKEKPARAAMKLFETLYALYGRIDREGERVELILGDGILSWRRV